MTDKEILNLAQAELRALYKRLGINESNVLNLIDEALIQQDAIKNKEAVCLITDEQQKCSYRSDGKCLYKNACAHKQTVIKFKTKQWKIK